jgi:hypothetical protein
VRSGFLVFVMALGLAACEKAPEPVASTPAEGQSMPVATTTVAASSPSAIDNSSLKGATSLWASAPANAAQVPKPQPRIVVPVTVHHVVHPAVAAKLALRRERVERAGDSVAARTVEERPGDRIGRRPGDSAN